MKLSKSQEAALERLSATEWRSAHEVKVSLVTLWSLEKRSLIEFRTELGYTWSPRDFILWRKKP